MRLGDVCRIKYGKNHKKLADGQIPVYGSGGIMRHVDKALWGKPSVLIPRKGTLGNLFFADQPFWTVDTLFWTDIDTSVVMPRFLYYALKTKNLAELNVGTAVPSLTTEVLNEVEVDIPDFDVQASIVNLLQSFDEAITLNRRTNDYLEELFSCQYQRFIEEAERAYVPLTEVIFFQEGPGIRNWQYVYDGDGVNFINIRCIQNHDFDLTNANQISTEEAYGKYKHFLVEPGDILMSSSGTLGRYAIARSENLPLCMNTSVIRFRPLMDADAYAYVYGYLTSQEFFSHLTNMATGSAQVNFGPTHLKQIEIPLPSVELIHEFNAQTMPLIWMMTELHSENGRLAELRNALLPKLMSGEIDVSQIELPTPPNNHLYAG